MLKRFILALTMMVAMASSVTYANSFSDLCQEVCEQDQEIADAYEKVVSLYDKNEHEGRIKAIDELIALSKQKIENITLRRKFISYSWSLRGNANHDLGCYKGAISDYDTALSIDEQNGFAYFAKGLAFLKLGDEKMAKVCIKISAKIGYRRAQEMVEAYNL